MATNTTRLGLIKPDFVDVVDVTDLNSNADDIDAAVGFTICTSSTRPSTPWSGQSIFETDTLTPYVWDGSAWQVAGGGGSIEISSTAPSSPSNGDLWWDSDDGKLYIYYDDGSSQQWVDAAGPSVAVQPTAPTGYEGQLWLDSTDGSMYVYYTDPGGGSSSWIGAVSRSGGILQVVSTTKTDTFSASLAQGASTPVTGLSATITPRSTSSKILITVSIGQIGTGNGYGDYGVKVFDGSSFIDVGDAASNRQRVTVGSVGTTNSPASYVNTSISFTIEDAPATTSSRTYSVYVSHGSGSTQTQYVNRSAADTDNTQYHRSSSTITLMEVAG